jgi:hypothetical protein
LRCFVCFVCCGGGEVEEEEEEEEREREREREREKFIDNQIHR